MIGWWKKSACISIVIKTIKTFIILSSFHYYQTLYDFIGEGIYVTMKIEPHRDNPYVTIDPYSKRSDVVSEPCINDSLPSTTINFSRYSIRGDSLFQTYQAMRENNDELFRKEFQVAHIL